MASSLVILLKVYAQGVAVFLFKGDTPWAVDRECEADGLTLKLVEPPSRHVQLSQVRSLIERRQPPSHTVDQVGSHSSRIAIVPEPCKPSVPEAPDHLHQRR